MDEIDFYTDLDLQAGLTLKNGDGEGNISQTSNILLCLGNETSRRIQSWMNDLFIRQPSHEEILKWKDSFEACINNRAGCRLFQRFLCSEFSEDNLNFWMYCKKYKSQCQMSRRIRMARKIYGTYLVPGSSYEVNLCHRVRREIQINLEFAERNLFDEARRHIQTLMENDSYKRFVMSVLNTLITKQNERTN